MGLPLLITITNQCLNHVCSLCSQVFDCVKYIHNLFQFSSFNGNTQSTVCTSTTHASTAWERGEEGGERGGRRGGRGVISGVCVWAGGVHLQCTTTGLLPVCCCERVT